MAVTLIRKIAVPVLNVAAKAGAALGKAAGKRVKPDKLFPKQKPTVSKSRPAKNQDPKTGPGAFSSGERAIKPVMGQFKTALKKAGARQTNQEPFASNSLARLSGKPKTGVLKQNIDNAIKQVRVKKSVKAKTGVRNEGRAVKNTRATKPSQRLKAMNARVSNSNKVAAAKTARGGTKLSKPTTKTRTATDNIKSADRRKGGGNRQPTSGVNAAQMRTATKALGARSGSSKTSTDNLKGRTTNVVNLFLKKKKR